MNETNSQAPSLFYATFFALIRFVCPSLSLMSRSECKSTFQSTSCSIGLLGILIYFIFDIMLCVLVEFHNEDIL